MSLTRMFLILLLLLIGCIPGSSIASVKAERLIEATVEIYDGIALWSGVIVKSDNDSFYVLTVIHDNEVIKLAIETDVYKMFIRTNLGEVLEAKVIKWDWCTELALLKVEDNHKHKRIKVAYFDASVGSIVDTAGNPLGYGIKYGEGVVSATKNEDKICTMWSTYTGGIISGQTGSPIVNQRGRLVGMVTALATRPVIVVDEINLPVGVVQVPVYHMGYYITLDTIKGFLIGLH